MHRSEFFWSGNFNSSFEVLGRIRRTSVFFFSMFSLSIGAVFSWNLLQSRNVAVSINETHLSKNLFLVPLSLLLLVHFSLASRVKCSFGMNKNHLYENLKFIECFSVNLKKQLCSSHKQFSHRGAQKHEDVWEHEIVFFPVRSKGLKVFRFPGEQRGGCSWYQY